MNKLVPWFLVLFFCTVGKATEPSLQEKSDTSIQTQETYVTDKILLHALDKVTGRVITLEAEMNTPIAFGTLQIVPRFCQKSAPEDPPESTAFLEILEILEKKPHIQDKILFQGWMFASSPAISALEHPVYDVWVKECSGSLIKSKKILVSPSETKSPLSNEMKAFYEGLGEIPENSDDVQEKN